MKKNYIPTWYFPDLLKLNPEHFLQKNYHTIFCDIDNTLCCPYQAHPDPEVIDWILALKKQNIQVILISNNNEKRVSTFAASLDVPYLYKAKKPSCKKLLDKIEKLQLQKSSVLLIGDQIMTDVLCANKAKVDVLLVNRKTKKDQWITFIPRRLDIFIRKRLKKNNLLRNFI